MPKFYAGPRIRSQHLNISIAAGLHGGGARRGGGGGGGGSHVAARDLGVGHPASADVPSVEPGFGLRRQPHAAELVSHTV